MLSPLANPRRYRPALCLATLAALVSACGGGSSGNVNLGDTPATEATLALAVSGSAYGDVLIDCVNVQSRSESCLLSTLPLLAQQPGDLTIDAIMARTVISHAWMANRFREYLEQAPAELLPLFRAVTAVVIAADVRPSQYSPITGAIYIDPGFLWTTNAEKATVSRAPDYRADFGRDLDFVPLSRYVAGTEYAWRYYSLSGSETRTIDDLVMPLTSLMFHELAHANDFFPPDMIDSLDMSLSAWDATDGIARFRVSSRLNSAQPLTSQVWKDLARVMYRGDAATAEQLALSAQQVGLEFEIDGASDSYSYTSIYEDVAMLFEEVMMGAIYGIDREIAFADAPLAGQETFCDAYIIRWGFRDRIGDTLVESRAEQVLQLLLDQVDVGAYTAGLGAPQAMTDGNDWCTVEALGAAPAAAQPAGVMERQPMRPDSRPLYR
jgi:hypothetical protein